MLEFPRCFASRHHPHRPKLCSLLPQVEGCHNYPEDYHVPSLEECGVNGLCKPGFCYRSSEIRIAGDDLQSESSHKVIHLPSQHWPALINNETTITFAQ
jgi:hypothetical protein